MSTLFKTLYVDSVPGETRTRSKVRQVIRRHTKDHVYDGQAIYDELAGMNALAAPAPDERETLLEPWETAGQITLLDGTPAGIKITRLDNKMYVEIFAI